jgi:DNA-directed RNA polymerase subunit omega
MGEVEMIDELREEEIIKKVGGRFKLSTLIQKRLVQLNAGSRPLVDPKKDNNMQVVINEILQDKIFLDTEMNVQAAAGGPAPGVLDLNFGEP